VRVEACTGETCDSCRIADSDRGLQRTAAMTGSQIGAGGRGECVAVPNGD
jgi:hypothetical protein